MCMLKSEMDAFGSGQKGWQVRTEALATLRFNRKDWGFGNQKVEAWAAWGFYKKNHKDCDDWEEMGRTL